MIGLQVEKRALSIRKMVCVALRLGLRGKAAKEEMRIIYDEKNALDEAAAIVERLESE